MEESLYVFTDSPLSVVIDRLFDLLSEPVNGSDHGILRETEKFKNQILRSLLFQMGGKMQLILHQIFNDPILSFYTANAFGLLFKRLQLMIIQP